MVITEAIMATTISSIHKWPWAKCMQEAMFFKAIISFLFVLLKKLLNINRGL